MGVDIKWKYGTQGKFEQYNWYKFDTTIFFKCKKSQRLGNSTNPLPPCPSHPWIRFPPPTPARAQLTAKGVMSLLS